VQSGIFLPDKPPNNSKDLQKLVLNAPSRELSQKDCQSLNEIINAWLETKPPAEYPKFPDIVPGETAIFVSWDSKTVTSIIGGDFLNYSPPRRVDEKLNPPKEFYALMDKLSYYLLRYLTPISSR
jgi:hypothetical protein